MVLKTAYNDIRKIQNFKNTSLSSKSYDVETVTYIWYEKP